MIDSKLLLNDLKRWVTRLEDDLRERCREIPEVDERFRERYGAAKKAKRTAHPYETWRDEQLTQVAVGWVLASVFVRFLEDNGLLEHPWLSGPGDRREEAAQARERFFREHPTLSDRNYLEHVFTEVGRLPGMADLFDRRHNPLWWESISGDAAGELITFWRKIEEKTGKLRHDFTDPEWDTRFLGDLYQDLSEAARKNYALLQTPEFVEEFILDRTLEPAIETFGYEIVRMIDPTCGSGHFLLGAFLRLLERWRRGHPELNEREVTTKALKSVFGVDINPFAVAIARFRLLLEAWRFCGITRLRGAPAFKVNVEVGDSLLHGARFRPHEEQSRRQATFDTEEMFQDEIAHFFEVEDREELHRILGQQYHAVVGNPPYITVKDKALNQLYRDRYDSCHRTYALSVPFMERFFDLALAGDTDARKPAGFTGQITSNSFMKREFGKNLIEEHIPRWNLTHVIDTSGAYIPGHGTPTVILFGRNAQSTATTSVRTVLGIKGEPATPADPAQGKVWSAIIAQIDRPGSESEFVSAANTERERFCRHPWSIGGGGAAELKNLIVANSHTTLLTYVEIRRKKPNIGFASFPGLDDAFISDRPSLIRSNIEECLIKPFVTGDSTRDWKSEPSEHALVPYDQQFALIPLAVDAGWYRYLWINRLGLNQVVSFGGKTRAELGASWWGWYRWVAEKYRASVPICFASVATHNHFISGPTQHVFKQSAPLIVLRKAKQAVNIQCQLLGFLNSAAACFWMKQVFHCKGSTVDTRGARQTTMPFEDFYDIDGTKLKQFPIPEGSPLFLARELDRLAKELSARSPDALAARDAVSADAQSKAEHQAADLRARMVALQEELDWQCYRLYGLIEANDDLEWPEDRLDKLPPLTLGERAFEIRMARQMAEGELETTWFERHKAAGSKPITELPAHWPAEYRALVERRLEVIEEQKNINLIERPEFKRRWNTEPWESRQQEALRKWLLVRLESYFFDADRMVTEGKRQKEEDKSGEQETGGSGLETETPDRSKETLKRVREVQGKFAGGREPALVTTRQLADAANSDPRWMEAAAVYRGRHDFDVAKLVRELVEAESVPYLPAQRYKPTGLRNRRQWERTWDLQRAEDELEATVRRQEGKTLTEVELRQLIRERQQKEVGEIPVPPKYKGADFQKTAYWKLRGKLDVPKERWVLYPGAERETDPSPVIAWAGWDHKQQAQALAAYYQARKDSDGWSADRLAPLLAGLKDLLPWLKQWHNKLDPTFNLRLGDFYADFVRAQSQELGLSEAAVEEIRLPE